tara:strand:+ start:1254 stop:1550 length:297 start_codon:yes stop_codon:yes gene_type:complete
LDDALGLLAIVNIDAGHVDLDIARSNDDAMIIESLMGLILTVSGGNSESSIDPAQMVLKGIIQGNKIIQKEKNKEMDDSIHEELHQMTKDYIYKLGRK